MSESGSGRRINRTLTQRYDMTALRALQKLETQIVQKIAAQMGVEEDDLDIEVDLLRVFNSPPEQREGQLKEMFATVPDGPDAVTAELLAEFEKLDSAPPSK